MPGDPALSREPQDELCFPSRCFVVGSKDMSTWVFGAERWDNLIYYALGGHRDAIVACFFEADSLDVRPRSPPWVGALGPPCWPLPGPLGTCGNRGQAWGANGACLSRGSQRGRQRGQGSGSPFVISSQVYTLSQDGALCVWQCDTPPAGLRLKAPSGWRADLQRREGDEDEEDNEEEERAVRGKAAPAAEEQQGKVRYSRLAK